MVNAIEHIFTKRKTLIEHINLPGLQSNATNLQNLEINSFPEAGTKNWSSR
jgi:hypothetical protein